MEQILFNVPNSFIRRNQQYIYENDKKIEEYESPDYRSEFMRDRDRLLYSTAFRRLAGKTQIYTVGTDDHKRNRLTHTLEVAQIARTIAKALGLDEDLAEAIAIAHDFGHTPFGHAGEQMLHEIMLPNASVVKKSPFRKKSLEKIKERFERECQDKADYIDQAFGFKHNLQSVRVNVCVEDSYRDDLNNNIGLNLTNYTLYGTMVHSRLYYKNSFSKYPNFQNAFEHLMLINDYNISKHDDNYNEDDKQFAWSFEAYIVAMADEIAQWHHDLEDALRGGALPIETIWQTIKDGLGESLNDKDKKQLDDIKATAKPDRKCIAILSHIVINTLVSDIVNTSLENFEELEKKLKDKGYEKAEQWFANKKKIEQELNVDIEKIISLSKNIDKDKFEIMISGSVHHSRNVERMNEKGRYIIRKLFEAYYAHPQQLPDGPILHTLVETQYVEKDKSKPKYPNIDEALKVGIGPARVDFEKLLKNPNIYVECILMRRICDHIACMTDHYAIEEYNHLYG